MPTLNDPVTFAIVQSNILAALMTRSGTSVDDIEKMNHTAYGATQDIMGNIPANMFYEEEMQQQLQDTAKPQQRQTTPVQPVTETPTRAAVEAAAAAAATAKKAAKSTGEEK